MVERNGFHIRSYYDALIASERCTGGNFKKLVGGWLRFRMKSWNGPLQKAITSKPRA